MKTNVVKILCILIVCILWGVYFSWWWWRSSLVVDEKETLSWLSTLRFQSPVKPWVWYVGSINGWWQLGWSDKTKNITIRWELWFGYTGQQSLLYFSWSIGWRDITVDYLVENHISYIRSRSFQPINNSWVENNEKFIDTLLWKVSDTNNQFVQLQNYKPYRRISSIVTPQKIITALSEYVTTIPWSCTKKSCFLQIDTDLLSESSLSKNNLNPQLSDALSRIWTHQIIINPKPLNISIKNMLLESHTLQWSINNKELSVQLSMKGWGDKLIRIVHAVSYNKHTIDMDIDQKGETSQSRRSTYTLFPDWFNAQLFWSSPHQEISLSGEWYAWWSYIPLDKWEVISMYGLLWWIE